MDGEGVESSASASEVLGSGCDFSEPHATAPVAARPLGDASERLAALTDGSASTLLFLELEKKPGAEGSADQLLDRAQSKASNEGKDRAQRRLVPTFLEAADV